MVLRLTSLAILLAAAPLAAQVTKPARTRAPLGVEPVMKSQGEAGWLGFRHSGGPDSLVVLEVAPGSPADRAGLRTGDWIAMIGDRVATRQLLLDHPPMVGETRTITVRRGNETLTFEMEAVSAPPGALKTRVTVAGADTVARKARLLRGQMAQKVTLGRLSTLTDTLSTRDSLVAQRKLLATMMADTNGKWRTSLKQSRPLIIIDGVRIEPDSIDPASVRRIATLASRENAIAGAELEQLNPGLADYFSGVSDGVFVLRVAEATPAASADLRPGDVVQTVNGSPVLTIAELREAVTDASGTITLRVLRKAKPVTVVIRKE